MVVLVVTWPYCLGDLANSVGSGYVPSLTDLTCLPYSCSPESPKGKKTTTSPNGRKKREADAGDASQAYGQAGLAPVASVVNRVPFTAVC